MASNFPNGITADVTGDITGDLIGAVQETVTAYADDGAITVASHVAVLTKGTAQAMTLAAPTSGTHDGIIIKIVSTTAAAHTITATTIGFNAGNAGADVATLGGAIGDGLTVIAYQGEWYIVSNINATLA